MEEREPTPIDVVAEAIDDAVELQDVGDYGYGGEIYSHYEVSNTSEVAALVLERLGKRWAIVDRWTGAEA